MTSPNANTPAAAAAVQEQQEPRKAGMLRAGGMWKHKTRDGKVFLSGSLGPGVQVFLYPNDRQREGKRDPDYFLYFAEPMKQQNAKPKGDDL